MPIYWSMFFLSLFVLISSSKATRLQTALNNNQETYFTPKKLYLFTTLYILFWVGCRDYVLDTYAYKMSFVEMHTGWNEMLHDAFNSNTGHGFYLIMGLFKSFISENHYLWFAFVGAVSIYSLFHIYRKYTSDYAMTFFLFIASTNFTWLINGMRQFVVACILVGFCDWLINGDKRHKLYYYCLIFALTYIHSSAIFMLPICYFTSRGKLLDKWMILIAFATIIATNVSGDVLEVAYDVMDKDYTDSMERSAGSNIMRLLISAVPLGLVLYKFKQVKAQATPAITFFINMSLVGVCFFFVATFTNGLLVGRMPIFFTLYNYILLPWLLKKFYRDGIFKCACILFYSIFFYYQMCITWHHLAYGSDLLDIHFFNTQGF